MSDRAATSSPARQGVRAAGRHDVPGLVDLRVRFLGERARLTKKPGIPADVRARNEGDKRLELARRRFAQFAAPGGPWEVKDVSQTGFRLLAPMSVANAVTLGTLAAIRPHGQMPWTLGIVRRMKRMTADRAEIGLQVIANTIVGVDLVEQRKGGDGGDYSVDGMPTTNGRMFHALFLALRKRDAETGVQSLIVPAAEYQPAKRLKLMTSKSVNPIRFGRLIEQQPEWVWATVESGDQTVPLLTVDSIMEIPPAAANE